MLDIISIGECMIELFSDRPLEEADTFTRSLAGDSLNILVAASRLGTRTGYITRVGSDPFTPYLLNAWHNEGIDISRVKQVEGFNAVHFVVLGPNGLRDFIYYRKGSAPSTMEPSDLDPEYIGSAKILHLSGIAQAISRTAKNTIRRAAEIAQEKGVKVSYDPNYRCQLWTQGQARKAMEEILPYVTYFLLSAPADTEALFGTDDARKAIDEALDRGVNVVSVTRGEYGAVIGTKDEVFEVAPITPAPVVDTTGAGDAYNGGFLHALLKGLSIRDAATLASIVAGLKIRGRGALTAMPTSAEVYEIFGRMRNEIC